MDARKVHALPVTLRPCANFTCFSDMSHQSFFQADLFSKENAEGQIFLEAVSALPLVLVSTPGTTTECVWRGLEVGAAEVLEKPLSLLKLQNIWQHVVRKVCSPSFLFQPQNSGVLDYRVLISACTCLEHRETYVDLNKKCH